MNSKYFRRRKPFDFDPHPLDVGVPFSKNDTHADVHFLIKVQRLPESQLEDLFLRHFNYYKAEFNDTDGREFFKELWQTVNSELKKERSKSQEKLSATQKRRNDLRIQKFQYFIENILPKYDRWNFTVSLSKKYEIVSEQLLQEVKSKTQIEFQRTQELIDSAFTKLANSSNASTESNINTIKTILENYLDSNKEEQEELKKQFIQKQNLDRLLAQYNTTLKELDEFKEQVKKLKKEKSRLNSLDHHKINILNGDKLNLISKNTKNKGSNAAPAQRSSARAKHSKTAVRTLGKKKLAFYIVTGLALIYFIATLITQQLSISQQNRRIEELQSRVSEAQQQAESLKTEVDNLNNPEYIERIAREQLGLVRPNERVFIDSNKSENNK